MPTFVDGFSNNQSSGFTICDEEGILLLRKEYPRRITCNEAELQGVLAAVEHISDTTLITDSKIAMSWIKRGWCKARPDLTPIARRIKSLLTERRVKLVWMPREQNLAGHLNEEFS